MEKQEKERELLRDEQYEERKRIEESNRQKQKREE